MKWLVITTSLLSIPSLMGMVKYAPLTGNDNDIEFIAQQETKRRSAQENGLQHNSLERSFSCFDFLKKKKRTQVQDLNDGCEILFRLKNDQLPGNGLPKALQQCVFSYLQEKQIMVRDPLLNMISMITDANGSPLLNLEPDDENTNYRPGKFEQAVIDQCKKDQLKSAAKQKCIVQ